MNIKKSFGIILSILVASEAYTAEIEEIIVTATKRGEIDVQSIPGSVHVLHGDYIGERGIANFEDFAGSVPGLTSQDLGPGDKEYIIRGINGNGPSVVGAYFDEYVITAEDLQDGGGKNAPIKLVDIARVEVLNGPQGTLYGANSMAGNIRFIPQKAEADALRAFINIDSSGTPEGGLNQNVSGAVNVPVIREVLAVRGVGWYADNGGWIDQPRLQTAPTSFDGNAKDINDEETLGGRLLVGWSPTPNLTLEGMYLYQDMKIGGSSRFTAKDVPAWPELPPNIAALPGLPDSRTILPGIQSLTPDENFINTDVTRNSRDDVVELIGGSLEYNFALGTATIAASYYEHFIDYRIDANPLLTFFGVPIPSITLEPQTFKTKMGEARFASSFQGPLNFVAGLYYQREDNDFEVIVTTTDGMGGPVPWDPANANDALTSGGTAFFGRFRQDEKEQKAAFGEVTFDVTDQLNVLLGMRVFDAESTSIQATTHGFGGQVAPGAGEVIGTTVNGNGIGLLRADGNTVNPKVSLSYRYSDKLMVYGLYSEGFRVGGINNGDQPFVPGIPETFNSDELKNYEIGIKSLWLNDSLRLNATAFFIDWDNIQVEPRDPLGAVPFITNGGTAEVSGLEWSVNWLPSEKWDLLFSGTAFSDAQLTEDQPILPGASPFILTGLEGDEIPNIASLQWFASAKYNARLFNKPLALIADITFRGDTDTEFRKDSPFNIHLESYVINDIYANWEYSDNVILGVFVKNVWDELAIQDGINTMQDPTGLIAARPLTFGAKVTWKFD